MIKRLVRKTKDVYLKKGEIAFGMIVATAIYAWLIKNSLFKDKK